MAKRNAKIQPGNFLSVTDQETDKATPNESIGLEKLRTKIPNKPQLICLRVDDLFGQFTYTIDIPVTRPVTLITSPNGYGKSTLLRIINSFAALDFEDIAAIPFEKVLLSFDNDFDVHITVCSPDGFHRSASQLEVRLFSRSKNTELWSGKPWKPRGDANLRNRSKADYAVLWSQYYSGQRAALEQAGVQPSFINKVIPELVSEPEEIRLLRQGLQVRFISVQRLNLTSDDLGRNLPKGENLLAIRRIASLVAKEIERAQVAYGVKTREQDRTFVGRALDAMEYGVRGKDLLSLPEIIRKIQKLEREYQRLAIIEPGATPQLRNQRTLGMNLQPLLSTYYHDILDRFSSQSEIAAKLSIFIDSANEMLQLKSLELNRIEGFRITGKSGGRIPIERLSSGEQHILVLLGLLLFDTEASDLILIDEPEISLHPAWQEMILKVIEKVAALNNCRIIMATHSPLLINGQWELAIELAEQVR